MLNRRLLAILMATLCLLAFTMPGAEARRKPKPGYLCTGIGDKVRPLELTVGGERATGRYAVPNYQARGLVVFAHGYGHTSFSWDQHMLEAERLGLIAVTMDYRGLQTSPDSDDDGLPESRGWNALKGAEDLIEAARFFEARCKVDNVTMLSVSMGGNMSGLALAIAGERHITRADGRPLFDYWIDVEGSVNMVETYLAARAAEGANEFAKKARVDIESETGGPIEQDPAAYRSRTVVDRVDDIKDSGLKGAVVIHGLDDGLVPYNQSREITHLLRDSGIPTEMYTIARRDADSERETTLTGHAVGAVYKDYTSPLSGHASEKSTTHIVMEVALARLRAIWENGRIPEANNECLIDGGPILIWVGCPHATSPVI